jgi:hypothetical protein
MIVRRSSIALAAVLLALTTGPLAAQAPARKLQLSFDQQGNVTLIAEGVTVNEILREWTRVGGSQFPGAEKLVSSPLPPVHFENHPEAEVLKSLLRSAAGYLIAPRPMGSLGPSRLNVAVVATSTATASAAGYSSISSPSVPFVTPGVVDETQANPGAQQAPQDQQQTNRPAGPPPGPAQVTVPTIQPIGTSGTQPNKPDTAPGARPTGRGGGSPR